MWPILIGFVAGSIVYFASKWVSGRFGAIDNLLPDVPRSIRIFLVVATSALCITVIFVVVHVWPPLAITFEHTIKGWELFWAIFHSSNIFSGLLGFVLGLITSAWYIDAGKPDAPHVRKRGIVIAVFAAVTLVVGLDRNVGFLNRISKLSISTVSIELDNAHGSASGVSRAPNSPNGPVSPAPAATERIGTALTLLQDVTSVAIERDWDVAHFVSPDWKGALPKERDATARAQLSFFRDTLSPLIVFRGAIHRTKRDANPIFFEGERLEAAKFALALRELVLFDLRSEQQSQGKQVGHKKSREEYTKAAAVGYADLIGQSRQEVCVLRLFGTPPDDVQKAAKCDQEEMPTKRRDEFEKLLPDSIAVRETPYLAILAAILFYGSGESDAAVSLLDQWLVQGSKTKAPSTYESQRENLAAIHLIRVLNLMSLFMADRDNPPHLELAARYIWSALAESDAFIAKHERLSEFKTRMDYRKSAPGSPATEPGNLLTVASDIVLQRAESCPGPTDIPPSVAYFVLRRANQLNNLVFYMTLHPDLLDTPLVQEQFDAWVNKLINTRVGCLTIVAQSANSSKRAIANFADTLAHGFLAQAILRKADAKRATKSLCRSYRAGLIASKLAADFTTPRADFGKHRDFLVLPFELYATQTASYQFSRSVANHLRAVRLQIEALGEGACADMVGNKPEIWFDDIEQ